MNSFSYNHFLFLAKAIALTLASLLSNHSLLAQETTLNGKVKSSFQAEVAFANVALLSTSDSSLIKLSVTDEKGNFRFAEIPQGSYLLRISSVGYKSHYEEISTKNMPREISLEEDSTLLAEVGVTSQKPLIEVFADKTVLNVDGTISASGVSALELLRKAPGVLVDNNENLIVEGRSGVQIYIDDKLSPLSGEDLTNFLTTLQSNDIEAIEVITQPSSKFDAAGTAGILNIKLKKNKNHGTNGSVNLGYAIGRFSKYNSGFSLNKRNKMTNFFANYSNNMGKNYSFINLYRIQSNTIFDAQSSNISQNQRHNTRLGLDYYASPTSTFGLMLSGNFSEIDSENQSITPILSEITMQSLQVLRAENHMESSTENLNSNLNYRYADSLGRSLNLDLDFGRYGNDRFNVQPNFYFDAEENNIENHFIYQMITPILIHISSLKADYEQPWLGGKVSLGLKSTWVGTENTFEFYEVIEGQAILNNNRSNHFRYTEHINAAYLNFNKKWGKANLQFGLRAEQTNSEGDLNSLQENELENVKRSYLDFFPSAGMSYSLNPSNGLTLSYSKRIERPNYRTLNPFEMQIDELSFSQGNPFLQPQYTHALKLTHTFNYVLNTSVSFSRTHDFIAQVTDAVGISRSVIQPQNIANQEVINLGISYPFNLRRWWNVFASLNAFSSSFEAKDERFVALTQNTISLYGQNNFSLPKGFQFEVSGWYSSPSVWGGTYVTNSLGSLDLALQKKLLQEKLNLRLALSDVFFTSPWRGETQFADVFIRGSGGWESRQLRINLSYQFGSRSVKALKQRKSGIEDENKRID